MENLPSQENVPLGSQPQKEIKITTPQFSKKKKIVLSLLVLLLIPILSLFFRDGFFFKSTKQSPNYLEPFALISDKVSQSAALVIHLPKGSSEAGAKDHIIFEPEIQGVWDSNSASGTVIFHPSEKLVLGSHYSVTFITDAIQIQKDFLVEEDPKIIAVFPASSTEANENSKITIVFNRPIVPLAALDAFTEEAEKYVEIIPVTPGKFKWTTTRNLQFIPEKRLQRASRYSVHIREGFISVEGLPVPETSYSFTTRPLRYESFGKQEILSPSSPFMMVFNQPVDLEKTRNAIKVSNSQKQDVPFIAVYGERILRGNDGKEVGRVEDKRILEINATRDRFGRSKLWDFNATYTVAISQAHPLEGDILLNEAKSFSFKVSDLITALGAESSRSNLSSANLFDPQGKLVVTFAEPVNKDSMVISAPHLKQITYGEKCDGDSGEGYYYATSCKKITDYRKLYLYFNDNFGVGHQFTVEFKKIINQDGLQLNPETVLKAINVYPALKILRVSPQNGATGVPPDRIVICTNSPLAIPEEDEFASRITISESIGLWDWRPSYRVAENDSRSFCRRGEIQTNIIIGLAPERTIEVTLRLVDAFGQTASESFSFSTAKVPEGSRSFSTLQKIYNVTSPDRTKLVYAVSNIPYLDLQICKVSPTTMLRYLNDLYNVPPPSGRQCLSVVEENITLPDRFWTKNYFEINLKNYISDSLGHYVVTFSNPDYRRISSVWDDSQRKYVTKTGEKIYENTFITVTQMAVQEKRVELLRGYNQNSNSLPAQNIPANLYWITSFGSLNPIVGASVRSYDAKFELQHSGITNGSGIARVLPGINTSGVIVSHGLDSAIVSPSVDRLSYASPARSAERAYIYTDKPIYRPGQIVEIKGIYRIGYDGDYETAIGKTFALTVRNSKREVVHTESVTLSAYGTFNTKTTIKNDAPLGTYTIETPSGYAYFDVEEYVASPFKVELTSNQEEYIAGDTANIAVDANYFFGVPVQGGEISYSITSQDYYFDRYRDGYFSFGSGWYYDYDTYYGDKFITRGTKALSAEGKAVISELLDFKTIFNDEEGKKSKIFVFNVTVKNENGRSVSAQKSFIVHRGELYLGVSLDKTFFGKNDVFTARIKSVDTQGRSVSAGIVKAEIYKIQWEYFKRREVDGGYYYTTERKRNLIKTDSMPTDRAGDGSKQFSVSDEGEYEFVVSGTDGRGNPITALQSFYVYGSGQVTVRPTNNVTLDLSTDKRDVSVGDTVHVIIKSPYEKAKALVTIERGDIFNYEVIDIVGNFHNYSFVVEEKFLPNFYFSAILLSPRPDIKFGQIQYKVDTKEAELRMNISTNKSNYLPGEEVRMKISALDSRGRPAKAELSLAVVDMSVLALKGNPKKNPVVFFYNGFPLTITTASNIKNVLYEAEIPAGTKGGGGGMEPDDLAKKKRGEFRETAYWIGAVETDSRGNAEVVFTLPDNLTAWQAEAVGVTKDTKLGVAYREFTARKNVMVTPLQPRFIIPGDDFSIGAQVFNQTDEPQTLSITLDHETLVSQGTQQFEANIKPHESKTFYFSVHAPENIFHGEHRFTIAAKNSRYEDVVESSFPISRNQTYETAVTSNYTTAMQTKEYIAVPETVVEDRGGVSIQMSATLAVYLSDALQYLFSYPYGSSEQIASKLSSVGIVKKGLQLKNLEDAFTIEDVEFEGRKYSADEVVALGLSRLYQNQTAGGGFAYYQNLRPNYHLTISVLNALLDLRDAGYSIDGQVVAQAGQYIYRELNLKNNLKQDRDSIILSIYVLSRLSQYERDSTLRNQIGDIAADQKFIQENISSQSLAHLAILTARGYASQYKEAIFKNLENRIVVDGRGAHLPRGVSQVLYQYYETPIKNTALFIKAYAADRRESPLFEKILRWIVRSRAKDGAWGSTNNTVSVVDALTDFLNWKKENESSFDLTLALDGVAKETVSFNSSTILRTFTHSIPIQDLSPRTIHTLAFDKTSKNIFSNGFYYDLALEYYLPIDQTAPRDEGFGITREFYRIDDTEFKTPVYEAHQGDVLRGRLTLTIPDWRNFVTIEDFIPSGMEIVNSNLATESSADNTLDIISDDWGMGWHGDNESYTASLESIAKVFVEGIRGIFSFSHLKTNQASLFGTITNKFGDGEDIVSLIDPPFYPDEQEIHDDRIFLFKERVSPGTYQFDYLVRALIPGKYHHLPAIVSELYFPENFGRTRGNYFLIRN